MKTLGEDAAIEWKEQVKDGFLKVVSAFANGGSGDILFGVTDDGRRKGLRDPRRDALRIESMVNDAIVPRPNFSIVLEEDRVVRLHVEQGEDTPYLYRGKAYVRTHTSTKEADRSELVRLSMKGMDMSFDEMPSKHQNLSFHILEKKLAERAGIAPCSENVLQTLGLIRTGRGFVNAAAILADENAFFGIDIVRYGDTDDVILQRQQVRNVSVLKQYDEAYAMYVANYRFETVTGDGRLMQERVPAEAFREAVANALAHRDWRANGNIMISMREDRIEVESPGTFPRDMTIEKYMEGGLSLLNNPILGNVLYRLGYIEHIGSGMRRILRSYRAMDAEMEPTFHAGASSIRITLPAAPMKAARNPTQGDVQSRILYVLERGAATRMEIMCALGLGRTTTIGVLKDMIEQGVIRKLGGGRSTVYEKVQTHTANR